jgi:hypothetical protein
MVLPESSYMYSRMLSPVSDLNDNILKLKGTQNLKNALHMRLKA